MAIEATLSRYKKKNLLFMMVGLIGIGLWFGYDGYKNDKFIKKNTTAEGTPNSTLNFNRKSPPFFIGAGILLGIYFLTIKGKKITANDNGLQTDKEAIAYVAIEAVNKTHFDSKGYFIVTYTDNGQSKEVKFSDRTYDNLPAVLDHIVAKIS